MSKMPSSQISRAGVVGTTAVKLGVGKLKHKVKRPFLDENTRVVDKEKQYDAEAEILFNAITQLRGTAVKVAQMIGMETELLPERIRTELAKSYHQVPPLNRVLVRKVIQEELGEPPESLFNEFNGTALAAASLGQVHLAKLSENRDVAVKVQYPGIHVSIDSDLKLLSKLSAGGIKLLPKHRQPGKEIIDTTVAEIGARLREETDYRIEAENTRWFKDNLNVDGVHVPIVHADYSSQRVITTQLLEGQHLDTWLESNPSQDSRNRAAQLIYDVFFHSATQLGRMHADPNPGNFLYKENGDIGLIDFGCVKKLSSKFVKNLPALLRAFHLNDYQKIFEAYASLGTTIKQNNQYDYESVLRPFGEWLSMPVREDYFDFKKNKDYTNSGRELIHMLSEMPSLEKVDEDFIFLDRTLYGMFKIFERLEAKVYMRGHWEKLWGEFDT